MMCSAVGLAILAERRFYERCHSTPCLLEVDDQRVRTVRLCILPVVARMTFLIYLIHLASHRPVKE